MTTLTFDTNDFIQTLKSADFTEQQAQAAAKAVQNAQSSLVTTEHFDHKIDLLREENKLTRWMLAIVVAANVLPVLKPLFS